MDSSLLYSMMSQPAAVDTQAGSNLLLLDSRCCGATKASERSAFLPLASFALLLYLASRK